MLRQQIAFQRKRLRIVILRGSLPYYYILYENNLTISNPRVDYKVIHPLHCVNLQVHTRVQHR